MVALKCLLATEASQGSKMLANILANLRKLSYESNIYKTI
jgi:hypothetical protein